MTNDELIELISKLKSHVEVSSGSSGFGPDIKGYDPHYTTAITQKEYEFLINVK